MFCVSALETAGEGGFSGAVEAVDVIYVVLGAAGGTLAAVLLIATAARRIVPALLWVAATAVAAWLTVASGQTGPVLAAVVLLAWCWSVGAALLWRLEVSKLEVGFGATIALSMGLGMAVLSFALLGLALLGVLTDVSIAAVLIVGAMTLVVHAGAVWGSRSRYRGGLNQPRLESRGIVKILSHAPAFIPGYEIPPAAVDESVGNLTPSYPLSFVWAQDMLRMQRGRGQKQKSAAEPVDGVLRAAPLITELAALVAILGVALVSFAVCLTPQVSFDALHYHFAMPQAFLRAGGFVERPDIIQSYFPLGLEMDFVAAFWLGGETTANLLHWAFLPLTAALLWSAGDRWCPSTSSGRRPSTSSGRSGRPAGSIAAVLFALMPVVVWEATSASSDLAMTFFLVAGVYLTALRAVGRRADWQTGSSEARTALAAGLFTGAAVSFKLVSALYVAPVALAFLVGETWGAFGQSGNRAIWQARLGAWAKSVAAFGLGGVIAGAPWLVLRWVQTGNPVFPLLNDVFRSDKWPPVNERFDLPFFGVGTSASDFATFWWRATEDPSLFGQPAPSWFLGLPLILALGALVLLPALLRSRGALIWTATAFGCALVWFFFSQYHRYGLPAFALLCLPAGFAVTEAARRLSRWATPRALVLTGLVGAWFAAGVVVSFASFSLLPEHFPTDVLLGRESREAYRERWVPNYVAISAFDRLTRGSEDEGAILGWPYNYFTANRLYDVIVPGELSPFRRIVEAGLPADEMARALVEADVRWFVYDSSNPFGYEEWPPAWLAESVLVREFIERYMEVAFEENGVIVYRIVSNK